MFIKTKGTNHEQGLLLKIGTDKNVHFPQCSGTWKMLQVFGCSVAKGSWIPWKLTKKSCDP